MNGRSISRTGALVAVIWLASIDAGGRTAHAIDGLKVGDAFPDFSLARADGVAGVFHTAEDVRGKPAAIVFWRPRQQLSLQALRDLKAITAEIGRAKINVVAVDTTRATAEQIRETVGSEALPFPLLVDPDRILYGSVGVIASPTTLVLDSGGVLRFVLASRPRAFRQTIQARLRFLLGEIDRQQMERDVEPVVLKVDHDLAMAWRMYNLGRQLQADGKNKEALSVFEDAISRYPSLTEPRCALGFMKLSEGDLVSAAKHFQSALSHAPTSPLARLGKAVVLARSARADEAEPILLSLSGHPSVAARASYELGRIYQARGRIDRAVTFYREALTVVFPEPSRIVAAGPDAPAGTESGLPVTPAAAPTSPDSAAANGTPTTPAGVPTGRAAADVTSADPRDTTAPAVAPHGRTRTDIEPVVPPADAKFLGIMGCKKCHFQQWNSWKGTKMASAFELLEPGTRAEAKQARGLDPGKDYTTDARCLACHTTGYGQAGGYTKEPADDARTASALRHLQGVGCEGCHGPGSTYVAVHKHVQDNQRKYTSAEFFEAGQYRLDERVCAACHTANAPCIAPGTVFDFAKRKDEGTHGHYELRFRSR